MKTLLSLASVLLSFSVSAGWYKASNGQYYYTGGKTDLYKVEYSKKNPIGQAKSDEAWHVGLSKFLAIKMKKEILKNPPTHLEDGKKVIYDPQYGYTIRQSSNPLSKSRKIRGKTRKFTGGGELVVGSSGGIPQASYTRSLPTGSKVLVNSTNSGEVAGPATSRIAKSTLDCGEGLTLGPGDPCSRPLVPSSNTPTQQKQPQQQESSRSDTPTGAPKPLNTDRTTKSNRFLASGTSNGGMCQETLQNIATDYNTAMDIVEAQYKAALKDEGCDENQGIDVGQL